VTSEFITTLLFTDFWAGAIGAGDAVSDGNGGEELARTAKADAIFAVKVVVIVWAFQIWLVTAAPETDRQPGGDKQPGRLFGALLRVSPLDMAHRPRHIGQVRRARQGAPKRHRKPAKASTARIRRPR